MSVQERIGVVGGMMVVAVAALACKGGGAASDAGTTTTTSAVASASAAPTTTASAATLTPVTDQAIVPRLLASLSKAAGCGVAGKPAKGPNAIWCLVDGFDKGERDGSLDESDAYLGFSIGLSDDFPATQSLQKNVELSALAVDKRNGARFAWISAIKPSEPGEQAGINAAKVELTDLLKDDGYKAEIDGSLYDYVRGLSAKAKYDVTPMKDGWRLGAPATTDVRKVGKVLVAIEVPPAVPLKGIYVSIFTDKFGKKK